ncbi:tyrosine-type recombinase/integrase [Catenovulum adriaticum]|uniref:Tyrosine-type recombinase/integrase n=1 Tax=Catenovulum adriaticum TaxID=2984846 RepID=A0ABY7AKE5_9ALTE|nr:tyrosine-type recombinase/integrase [Catenovulum sp. TS8]WAJ69737.1 tyrosine-type recombinase/integrase [Catenovulum sp. TS8]
MINLPTYAGIKPNKSSIAIEFTYNNVRCRETIKCTPTKTRMQELARKREAILYEISLGIFDYAKHFPNSKKATELSSNKANAITIKQLITDWFERQRKVCQLSTIRGYKSVIYYHLIPQFGHLKLAELKPTMVTDWMTDLICDGTKPKRVNNILTPLRDAYKRAYLDSVIDKNPMDRVKNLKLERPDIKPFTESEINSILSFIPNESDRNMIELAFYTGLRTSEYMALTWSDVDFKNKRLNIDKALVYKHLKSTKTKSGIRTIELHDRALQALHKQKALNLNIENILFPDLKNKSHWHDTSAIRKRIWIPALEKADLEYRNPYQTRHTFASQMLSQGKNPLWVANQMGHIDWGMIIKTYGKWIRND